MTQIMASEEGVVSAEPAGAPARRWKPYPAYRDSGVERILDFASLTCKGTIYKH